MIVCPLSLHSAYTLSLNQVAIDKKDKHLKEGLNGGGGGGGGLKCQLSVKFLAISQLSVFFSAICQLSVKFSVVSKIAIDDNYMYGL